MDKTMKHKDSGIEKLVSEPVYPADILADDQLMICELASKGAWFICLLIMWRNKTGSVTASYRQFGRLWGCDEEEARNCIADLVLNNVCNVTKTASDVTLMSRRLTRRAKARKDAAKRKAEQREREASHAPVTAKKPLPSSSLSSSSSSSKIKKEYTPAFEEFWKAYPRRIGKRKAFTTYQQSLKLIDAATIQAKAEVYAKSTRGTEPQYIAHPSTWLNQGRWDDELTPQKPIETGSRFHSV